MVADPVAVQTQFMVSQTANVSSCPDGLVLGAGWAGQPKVLVQLNIEYEDGSRQEEFTDWGIGWGVARGPILYNNIYAVRSRAPSFVNSSAKVSVILAPAFPETLMRIQPVWLPGRGNAARLVSRVHTYGSA